jgi:hypothetical protein
VRGDPYDPLPGGQQRLLEPPRDVPAVLDRPDALFIHTTSPADRGQMSRLVGPDLPAAAHPAGALIDRRQRVRSLVRVRADHDHLPPSLRRLTTDEADLGGQLSLGAVATLLSGHAEGPRAATGDTTFAGQTGRQRRLGSARRQSENQPHESDVTAQTANNSDSERRLRGSANDARCGRRLSRKQ